MTGVLLTDGSSHPSGRLPVWEAITADPVAVYAAFLSTAIALAATGRAIYNWSTSGPRAWVAVLNPLEVAQTNRRTTKIIIANTGKDPFVVREFTLSWHASKKGKAEESARFYHGTPFDPAMKSIPNPNGKPNNTIRVPNIVRPGEELHQHSVPFDVYDASKHWLRAEVFISQRKTPIIGWAAPIGKTSPSTDLKETSG